MSVPVSPSASPIRRLATAATATCADQAKAYGQCILTSYGDARKDMCAAEFAKFKACLQTAVCPIYTPAIRPCRAVFVLIPCPDEKKMVTQRHPTSKPPGTLRSAGSPPCPSFPAVSRRVCPRLLVRNAICIGNPAEGNMNDVVLGNGSSEAVDSVSGGGSSTRLMAGRRRRCNTGVLRFVFDGDDVSSPDAVVRSIRKGCRC